MGKFLKSLLTIYIYICTNKCTILILINETNKWYTNIENLQLTENPELLLVNFSRDRILWILKNSPSFLIWMFLDFILVVLMALFKSTLTVISPAWKYLCTKIKWIHVPLFKKTRIKMGLSLCLFFRLSSFWENIFFLHHACFSHIF